MWSLSSVGDRLRGAGPMTAMSGLPDVDEQIEFCRRAERSGIDSVLMAFGFTRPDPVTYSATLAAHTEKIRFLVAVRSGITSPTYFVQQINTLSAVTGGRVCVNIVAGRATDELRYYGDFLSHDERYERTDEFWHICHALWRADGPVDFTGQYYRVANARINTPFVSEDLNRPEIFIGGNSDQARTLAMRHADCLLTLPDTPEAMAPAIRPVLASGTEAGLLVSLICKPTRAEAVDAAYAMVAAAGEKARMVHDARRGSTDSVGYRTVYDLADRETDWLGPYLWTGAVPYLGPPGIALVGSPDDIVNALAEYRSVGITRFLFMGQPDMEQMIFFGEEVLPRVRARESRESDSPPVPAGHARRWRP
jgi:alkanesulfonate monooxygenase